MNVTDRLRKHLWQVADFVFPNPCLSCGAAILANTGALGLCQPCHGELVSAASRACHGCGKALHAAKLPSGYDCGECRNEDRAYERLLAGWHYQSPLDGVLRGLKYRRLDYLGPLLASALVERYEPELASADLVVPVPLHWFRHLKRGYNQAETISKPLAKHLQLDHSSALTRRRATTSQTKLAKAERKQNLSAVFRISKPKAVAGRRVLLVDDVFTTGATLRGAALALQSSGAKVVYALTVGRTPRVSENLAFGEPPGGSL